MSTTDTMLITTITTDNLIDELKTRTEAHIIAFPGAGLIPTLENHYGTENVLDLTRMLDVKNLSTVERAHTSKPDATVIILSESIGRLIQNFDGIRKFAPDALLLVVSTPFSAGLRSNPELELNELELSRLNDPALRIAKLGPILVKPSQISKAIFRLMVMRQAHPLLSRAEAQAKNNLAVAIMAMDAVDQRYGQHNLQEQADVEQAKDTYTQALANLIRGEEDES